MLTLSHHWDALLCVLLLFVQTDWRGLAFYVVLLCLSLFCMSAPGVPLTLLSLLTPRNFVATRWRGGWVPPWCILHICSECVADSSLTGIIQQGAFHEPAVWFECKVAMAQGQ